MSAMDFNQKTDPDDLRNVVYALEQRIKDLELAGLDVQDLSEITGDGGGKLEGDLVTLREIGADNEQGIQPDFAQIFLKNGLLRFANPDYLPELMGGWRMKQRFSNALSAIYTTGAGGPGILFGATTLFGTWSFTLANDLVSGQTRYNDSVTAASANAKGGVTTAAANTVRFGNNPSFYCKFRVGSSVGANLRWYCGFFTSEPNSASPTQPYVAFSNVGTSPDFFGIQDGSDSTPRSTVTTVSFTADTMYEIEMRTDFNNISGGSIYFYIDGVLIQTAQTSTWDTGAMSPYFYFQTLNGTARNMKLSRMVWEMD